MIPLMMQKDYSPKGWLGLILGTRLWYSMWDIHPGAVRKSKSLCGTDG